MYSFCFNQPLPEYLLEVIEELRKEPDRWNIDNFNNKAPSFACIENRDGQTFICTNARFRKKINGARKTKDLQKEILRILTEGNQMQLIGIDGEKAVILGALGDFDTIKDRWSMILQAKQEAIRRISQT
jgi:hypothetical protein